MLNTQNTNDTLHAALYSLVTSEKNPPDDNDEIRIVLNFLQRFKFDYLNREKYPSYMLWSKAMEALESTKRPHDGLNLDSDQARELHSITHDTYQLIQFFGRLYTQAYKIIFSEYESHVSTLQTLFKKNFLKQLAQCEEKISLKTADEAGLISLSQLFPDMPKSTIEQVLAMPESNEPSIPLTALVANSLGMLPFEGRYTLTVHPEYAFLKANGSPWANENALGIMSLGVSATFNLYFALEKIPFKFMEIKTHKLSKEFTTVNLRYNDADYTSAVEKITKEGAKTATETSHHDLIAITRPQTQITNPRATQTANLLAENIVDYLVNNKQSFHDYLPKILTHIIQKLYDQTVADTIPDDTDILNTTPSHDLRFYQRSAKAYGRVIGLNAPLIDQINKLLKTNLKTILSTQNFLGEYAHSNQKIMEEITAQGSQVRNKITEKANTNTALVENYYLRIVLSHRYLENLAQWNVDARLLAGISRELEQLQILKQNNCTYLSEMDIDQDTIKHYPLTRQGERLLDIQQELTKHGFKVEAPMPDVLEHLKNEKDQEAKDIYNQDIQQSIASSKDDPAINSMSELKDYELQTYDKMIRNFLAICHDWNNHNQFKESTLHAMERDIKFHPIFNSMLAYEMNLRDDRVFLKGIAQSAYRICDKTDEQANPASFLHLVDEINIHSETADVIDSLNKINDHKRRILKDKGSFGVPGAQAGEIQPYSFSGVIQQQLYFWQVVCHLGGKVAHYFVPEECPNELNADEQVKATTLQNDIKDIRHKLKSLQNKGVINDPNLFAAHLNQLDIRTLKLLKQIARINHDQQALSSELKNIESATKEVALKLNDLLSKEKYIQDFQKSYKGNKNLIIGMEYRMFGEDKIVITEEEDSNPMDDNTLNITSASRETYTHTGAPAIYTQLYHSQRCIEQPKHANSMTLPGGRR